MSRGWLLRVAAALVACGFCGTAAAAPPDKPATEAQLAAACEHHPDMDLAAYVAAYSAPKPNSDLLLAINDFIPKDLLIENIPLRYVSIRGTAHSVEIPVDDDKIRGGNIVRGQDSRISPCRVQDATGRWWLVVRGGTADNLGLSYYRVEDFEREDMHYLPHSDPYVSNHDRLVTPAQPPLATEPCAVSTRSLKRYTEIAFDLRTWFDPDFKKVPAGLEMRPVSEEYVIIKSVTPRLLPGPLWYHVDELPLNARVTSVCHVRDDGGFWWAAYRAQKGYLVYLPLAELTAVKDLGAK